MIKIKINCVTADHTYYDQDCPAKRILCPTCDGKGTHVNPDIDGHGLTSDDFAQDPEFEEAYFSGRFDVWCHECRGERVVLEPLIHLLPQMIQDDYWRYVDEEAADRAQAEMERRAGA